MMRLTIATPEAIVADHADVVSIRAEDASGAFGILPGHADFLTALAISVLSWRHADGRTGYCAVHGGVLRVRGGVAVATRLALPGEDLHALEETVRRQRREAVDTERTERSHAEQMRIETIRRVLGVVHPERVVRSGDLA
jgi:F-type H+-transporting ATPase subunit epsilon